MFEGNQIRYQFNTHFYFVKLIQKYTKNIFNSQSQKQTPKIYGSVDVNEKKNVNK